MSFLKNKRILYILSGYFVLYIITLIYQPALWGNILSPIGAYLSFFVLLHTYLKSGRTYFVHSVWLFFSLACLSWAVADTLWAIYDLILKINPESINSITYLYVLTNLFIGCAVAILCLNQYKKWNAMQVILDVIATSTSGVMLIWIVFFDRGNIALKIIMQDGIASAASIMIDIVIIIGISIWYFLARMRKIATHICIVFFGVVLYALVDLYYYYIYYHNLYIPNSMIDAAYMASLLIIAFGANWKNSHPETKEYQTDENQLCNVALRYKGLLILICPIIATLLKGFVITDILIFALIILVYESFSGYVQTAISNRLLLQKEKELNKIVEYELAERTNELILKNEELIKINKELDFISKRDVVTKLYNRLHFLNTLDAMFSKITAWERIALIFIDLDRFKTINDTYGHDIGDKLLVEIGYRMDNWKEKGCCLARIGGDEFVLVLKGYFDYKEIEEKAKEIISLFGRAIEIERYLLHITMSIGISIFPFDAVDSKTLIKNADIAMYQAKSQGYNKCVSFNSQMNLGIKKRHEIELLLRKADFNNEFQMFFQPQFSLPNKELIGAEALIRWNKEGYGYISPSEFIPIAEEINYIIPIGTWVMQETINHISRWNKNYGSELKIGINISPKQLDSVGFIENLKRMLETSSIDPKWLDIEITESIAIEGEFRITEIFNLFERIGVSISIDDFGTGYSSLSYIKMFPFDRIKIAKPLIDTLCSDFYDRQIVKAIIMLAKAIGIKTIAEGVEKQDQLDILTDLGCEEIQGYLLGKPMSAAEFEKMFLLAQIDNHLGKDFRTQE